MLSYLNSKKNLLILFYFIILFLIGIFAFSDYGISLDEDNTRINGFVSLKYIFEIFLPNNVGKIDEIIDVPSMQDWSEQGIGIIFDLPTAFLELILKINDSRNYFLVRHFINFLFFFTSVCFFFFLIIKRYNSWLMGVLGSAFLFFSPRIFAQSFYNNKDMLFMSLFIICLYTAILFLEKPNIRRAIIFSLTSSLAIDVRILGVIIPVVILLFYIINILRDDKYKKNAIIPLILFLIVTPFFIVLFWPYLWENPIENFIEIFKKLIIYDFNIYTYYFGEYISSKNIKWHYPIVWILITTPLFYTTLFFIGVIYISRRIVKRLFKIEKNNSYIDLWRSKEELQDLIYFTTLIIPIIVVVSFNSTIYDGWRHLYFVYPSFLMIALLGFHMVKITFFKRKIILIYVFSFILLLPIFFWMYKNHPFQYVYFNLLSEKNFNKKFEMDYWGISNKQALEHIAGRETNKVNVVSISTTDLDLSKKILKKNEREKINIIHDIANANYIINNYRNWKGTFFPDKFEIPNNFKLIYELKVDDITINAVYKKL